MVLDKSTLKALCRYILSNFKKTICRLFSSMQKSHAFIVLASITAFTVIITNISPPMGMFLVRYIFPILPLFSVFIVHFLCVLLDVLLKKYKKIKIKHCIIQSVLVVIFITTSHILAGPSSFLQNINSNNDDFRQYFENSQIILVDSTHYTQAFSAFLMNSANVYPADKLDKNLLKVISSHCKQSDPLYLVIRDDYSRNTDEKFLSENEEITFSWKGDYYCSTDDLECHHFYEIN